MKSFIKLPLLIVLFIYSSKIFSQPAFSWAASIKGQGYDEVFDVALDTAGNVFICGQVEFTTYFSGYPLHTAGIHDIFIAKYSKNGSLLWAVREGGTGGDKAMSVAVDLAGNSYIVGEYEEDFTFGNKHVDADAGNNFFIAKYDPSGDFEWVETLQGGGETIRGYAVTVDPEGNVYAAGTFREDAEYDGDRLYTARGSKDVIVVKFTTDGDFVWAKRIGDSNDDEVWGLAVKGDKLYVTGGFETKTRFSSTTVHSNGDYDFYLAQYDTSGDFQWAQHGGGSGFDEGKDVTVSANGNIICTGNFRYSAEFDNIQVSSNGSIDAFVAAYDDNGDILWVRNDGGSRVEGGTGVTTDLSGNIYVTGDFAGTALFDTISISGSTDSDIYLAKYDSAGNPLYVKTMAGPENERARSCAVDKFGNVFITGEFKDYLELDTLTINGDILIDAFLTRLGNYPVCTATTQVTNEISCNNICTGAATVSATGEAPFTYWWTTASQQTLDSVYSLCPGSYIVTITDAFGCLASDTVLLNQPAGIQISNVVISNETCWNCIDGSIDITVDGGVPPYQFAWADGSTSEDRSNLSMGNYAVCITDMNNCTFCDTFFVANPFSDITDIESSLGIKIFNDVERGIIRVESKKITGAAFQISSTTGQSLITGRLDEFFQEIDISGMAKGVYFLSVATEKGMMGKTLVRD